MAKLCKISPQIIIFLHEYFYPSESIITAILLVAKTRQNVCKRNAASPTKKNNFKVNPNRAYLLTLRRWNAQGADGRIRALSRMCIAIYVEPPSASNFSRKDDARVNKFIAQYQTNDQQKDINLNWVKITTTVASIYRWRHHHVRHHIAFSVSTLHG